MKVLICGGRNYADRTFMFEVLDIIHKERKFTLIIHGGARGADYLAHIYAARRGIKEEVYNPDWRTFGKSAGPIRNTQMLEVGRPNLVVSFPGSSGTENMIQQAIGKGVELISFDLEGRARWIFNNDLLVLNKNQLIKTLGAAM